MNDFEKQVLDNQSTIMFTLSLNNHNKTSLMAIDMRLKETNDLLNPEHVPTLAEKTHDALKEDPVENYNKMGVLSKKEIHDALCEDGEVKN